MNANESKMGGEATVVRKAQTVQAGEALLRATITITRAATGAVETYELIGTPVADQEEK